MRFTRRIFGGVLGIALQGGFTIAGAEPAPLRFQLVHRHLVIVHGGIGPLEDLRFLIDTGAMPSMLDRKVAKKLALKPQEMEFIAFGQKARVATAVLPEIRLGLLRFQAVTAGIGDLSFVSGVDAIIGLDILSRGSFSIDYAERQLTFGPLSPRDQGLRLEVTPPFLTVQVRISGQPFRLMVDTGSGRLVLFQNRVKDRLPLLPVNGQLLISHLAGTSRLDRVLLPSVEAGDSTFGRVEGFISDASLAGYPHGIDGVLGVRVLAAKRVGFDFERHRLAFAP
jgi:predicted aspartyl protease